MKILDLCILCFFGFLVNVHAGRLSVGYGMLQIYRYYLLDFLTLPTEGKLTIAKGLVSSKGEGVAATWDEFIKHAYDDELLKGYNSKGLGATTDPPNSWGMKELRPANSNSFKSDGLTEANPLKLLPDWFQGFYNNDINKKAKMGPILFELTRLGKNFLNRPEKAGVDKSKILKQLQELGGLTREARWMEIQSFQIKNFNLHFQNEEYKAVTKKYTMLDGSVIDVFDKPATIKQNSDPTISSTIEKWITNYGTDAMEFKGGKNDAANAREIRTVKSHVQVVQDYAESNRLLVSGDMCSWHSK